MENIYLFIIIILVALAVVDLIVGVSNDAVNFLNSAVGSKVAPRAVILIIASVGILLGTVTSSGMMEIARSGVFHPGMFSFDSIMMIFLAVMITDVILLDIFNTLGLPTSTTVSMVFELLGAAVAVALYIMNTSTDGTAGELGDYINSGKALAIISGILISVVVAFVCGSVIMFLSRLLFSFRYKRIFRRLGALWCGAALTAVAWFALFKGLKNTTAIPEDVTNFISGNIQIVLPAAFAAFSLLLALLQFAFKVNILKIVILSGTGALALAFAGNDLVNFIGVTMAGISSYGIAASHDAAGGSTDTLMMDALSLPVSVNVLYLLAAGVVMVLAMWFSRKARTVTETEVNLSRSGEGAERFGSTPASRAIVRSAMVLNRRFTAILPQGVNRFIDRRFRPSKSEKKNSASFDQIRASVNLTVSALLISMATSLQLPLSTTYVTFMVAMGSSLSDRAWGRESAVYRITGVLTVISGWFMTALIAFTVAAITGLLLVWGGVAAIVGLLLLCACILIQSSLHHRRKSAKHQSSEDNTVIENYNKGAYSTACHVGRIYTQTLKALDTEDRRMLKKLRNDAKELYRVEKEHRASYMMHSLDGLTDSTVNTGHYYVQSTNCMYEIAKSLVHITKICFDHIDNNHASFSAKQAADLDRMSKAVSAVCTHMEDIYICSGESRDRNVPDDRDIHSDLFADIIKSQIRRVKSHESTTRNSILYLDIVSETRNIIQQSHILFTAYGLFTGSDAKKLRKKDK